MAKTATIDALDYLTAPDKHPVRGACAMYGDEAYLKREVLTALRRQVLGRDDDAFALSTFDGDVAELHEVLDALATMSLFGGTRLVIVEEADAFVSQHRGELETYVDRPAKGGVLVLEIKTWPANTRLAKAVAEVGLAIHCKSPTESQTKRWLVERAKSAYGVRLDAAAVDVLVELLPAELGVLDQEVARLSLLAGPQGIIDAALVGENVGGWRVRTTWDMIGAAADGRAPEALRQLDRLIAAGENPQGLLPQIGYTLRQFAGATRLIESAETDRRRLPLGAALQQAGVPKFKLADAERQLRQIGRARARQLAGWLLAADLAMKGHNSSDARARLELERLIVRLSTAASDRAATNRQ
jgi:DNA polymerase-3 subunit delta